MDINWTILQLADSAFPGGGFAHSGGLEAAYQAGTVRGASQLTEFIRTALGQTARSGVPFVADACDRPEGLQELDITCDAFLSNHIANRASRVQGRAYLAAADRTFGNLGLTTLRHDIRAQGLPGHFAPLFGAIAGCLDLSTHEAASLFLFFILRGLISAAVRLGIVGPLGGQTIQYRLLSTASKLALDFVELRVDQIAQTAPIIEMLQMNHDRLYSRLFQS